MFRSLAAQLDATIRRCLVSLEQLVRAGEPPTAAGQVVAVDCGGAASFPAASLDNDALSGIVWYCPVPKHRTSAEKKLTKRFFPLPNNFITKYGRPKTNIMTCLDCGNYHEIGTVCTSCYDKVKRQTEEVLAKRREAAAQPSPTPTPLPADTTNPTAS